MSRLVMPRRTMLRGLGTALVLPLLDSMLPVTRLFGAGPEAAVSPRRVAWIYVPNGIDMETWTPAAFGADYELSPTLKTLAAYRSQMAVISGLVSSQANAHGIGFSGRMREGEHACASAAYLTGVHPDRTGVYVGISADQVAAGKIGHLTKFPSLEIGVE